SNQALFLIGEMGVLDLQRAFPRASTAAKNFEDQSRAVDDLGRERFFQVALLNRRQGAVYDDEINVFRAYQSGKLGDVAFAEECSWTNLRERNDFFRDNLKADRAGKPESLEKTCLVCSRERCLQGLDLGGFGARAGFEIGAGHEGPRARLDNLPRA